MKFVRSLLKTTFKNPSSGKVYPNWTADWAVDGKKDENFNVWSAVGLVA
jgi:hypothetical protein